jgi:endonuclease/exonuclease/phosphatase family metal-dependent hydrolase
MKPAQLKIVSFNIWDLPYWFVKNREQRMLQISEYLRKLDAEIVCLQESFDVRHRRFLYESLGSDKYYASGVVTCWGRAGAVPETTFRRCR